MGFGSQFPGQATQALGHFSARGRPPRFSGRACVNPSLRGGSPARLCRAAPGPRSARLVRLSLLSVNSIRGLLWSGCRLLFAALHLSPLPWLVLSRSARPSGPSPPRRERLRPSHIRDAMRLPPPISFFVCCRGRQHPFARRIHPARHQQDRRRPSTSPPRPIFEPLQLGVETPNGCEATIMRCPSGFTATALAPPGLLCLWIFPMHSTRSIARLCSKLFARISPLSLRGWTAAVGTRVPFHWLGQC